MRRSIFGATLTLALYLAAGLPAMARAEPTSGSEGSGVHAPGGLLDQTTHTRRSMFSVMGILPWSYGFGLGVGARYTLPIVPDGFISKLNDSIELELGGDLAYGWYGVYGTSFGYTKIVIPAEARWTFHITPKFDAYAKAAVGLQWRHFSDYDPRYDAIDYIYWNIGPGVLYRLGDSLALRAELGYSGLHMGVGFDF